MKPSFFDQEHRSVVVTERVFRWWDYPLFVALSGTGVAAIAYFLSVWFRIDDWRDHPVILGVMTFAMAVVLINQQARWFLLPWMSRPKAMPPKAGWKVAVVTTFVDQAEPLGMLEETLDALVALDYPHETWVLDEADREQVREACRTRGVHHFSRKHFPHYQAPRGLFQAGSKHGNYNAWLYEIGFHRYEVVCAFDPDHVPSPTFLSEVLGYFNDSKVGYVQAAQAYYNQTASFIARGAAEETFAYYSSIQTASYGLGYPIITGCHNAHRVAALQEIGGFAPHDADDLLMTLLYRSHGWDGVYVPKILARGLTPVDWNGYLTQQRRWARSVLDLKLRIFPRLSGTLPLKTRVMSVLHGLNYLRNGILIPLLLLLLGIMLATGSAPDILTRTVGLPFALMIGSLQLSEWYRQRFYLDHKHEWGLHWRAALLQFAKWPYLLSALWDVALNRRPPYVLTRKVKQPSARWMMGPQACVAGLLSAAWLIGVANGMSPDAALSLCALVLIAACLFLLLTERWVFPDPYTRDQEDIYAPQRNSGASVMRRPGDGHVQPRMRR